MKAKLKEKGWLFVPNLAPIPKIEYKNPSDWIKSEIDSLQSLNFDGSADHLEQLLTKWYQLNEYNDSFDSRESTQFALSHHTLKTSITLIVWVDIINWKHIIFWTTSDWKKVIAWNHEYPYIHKSCDILIDRWFRNFY